MPTKINQGQSATNKQPENCNVAGVQYAGYIFLLGLITLVAEIIDLRAADTLGYLLQPFVSVEETPEEEEILGASFGSMLANADILSGFIPIGFE